MEPVEDASTVYTFLRNSGSMQRWISYDINQRQWKNVANQPIMGNRDFSCLVFGDEIYVFLEGGLVRKFEYKVENPVLHTRASMNHNRGWYTPVAEWNGSLFVTGSALTNAAYFERSAERYYPKLDRWVRIAPTNIARQYPCLIGAAGYVFCIGGANAFGISFTSAEKYDLRTNRWDMIPSTPRPTSYSSAVCIEKVLYLVDTKGMLSFDLVTNAWSIIQFRTRWPFQKWWFSRLLMLNHKMYCIGKRKEGYSITRIDVEEGICDDLVEVMTGKDTWAIQTVAIKF